MTKSNFWRIGTTFGLGALLLTGCATDQVQPDQGITLKPGEGIAAVVFDTLDVLSVVTLKSPDKDGVEIDVGNVGKGVTMFVYAVPAGTYCLTRFTTGFYRFYQDDPTHGICFDVVAGKVAYSGNLAPRAYGHDTRTDQNYYWPVFEKSFKQEYPKLAQYAIVTP
jgi:hypothetical protein